MVRAFYNENDPRMAAVLRELIRQGHIAPGAVDERSITDIQPSDLLGYTQCHFFAGIGVWSHALRRAGWPDDRPCWTGSCPCQPFSLAGKGAGFDDPRHLWPHWFRLIGECRPHRIFGEQVASAGQWLDLVAADLEGLGFAFGAVDLAAAGFAGAHIRQRFFFVADAWQGWADSGLAHHHQAGRSEFGSGELLDGEWTAYGNDADGCGAVRGLGLPHHHHQPAAYTGDPGEMLGVSAGEWSDECAAVPGGTGAAGWLGNNNNTGLALRPGPVDERGAIRLQGSALSAPSPLFGCDWLLCHDGKVRPVEPGTFPLVVEAPARVGRLHGYGNAIDAETCTQFIESYIASVEGRP